MTVTEEGTYASVRSVEQAIINLIRILNKLAVSERDNRIKSIGVRRAGCPATNRRTVLDHIDIVVLSWTLDMISP